MFLKKSTVSHIVVFQNWIRKKGRDKFILHIGLHPLSITLWYPRILADSVGVNRDPNYGSSKALIQQRQKVNPIRSQRSRFIRHPAHFRHFTKLAKRQQELVSTRNLSASANSS